MGSATWQAGRVTFTLTVDSQPWRAAAQRTRDAVFEAVGGNGGIVPVVKGNGYGLGNAALAAESETLGAPSVAVGTVHEAAEVAAAFSGDVVVLEPFDPRDAGAAAVWHELARRDGTAQSTKATGAVAVREWSSKH